MPITTTPHLLELDRLRELLPGLADAYQSARPYPHTEINDFLSQEIARQSMEAFPAIQDAGWIHYVHVNERKHGLNKMDLLPAPLRDLILNLNTTEFVALISQMTGIPGLLADPSLEGGGLHQSRRGGHLNVHADFTVHPHKRLWRRRVNLLLYLNEGWEASWGGALELWERDMSQCGKKILPLFNRVVVFNTDEDSYHGFPDPIQCPEDVTRKSIALYYFTEETSAPSKRATNYRARPGDGLKGLFIWADKQAVAVYNGLKGILGINDDFVSKVLGMFSRNKNEK
ncbi:MAG: 2OG-Fe(II) oxygenase [Saprospiraceae bacterium]|nr:2OG-Fe(II) oxygenase [Saprospiraceae bacterium]